MSATGRWARAWAVRRLVVEAMIALLRADLAVRWRGSGRITTRLGQPGVPEVPSDPAQLALARQVAWVVTALCARWPWRIVCLPQALAARAVLRRRGIPCALHLGVGRDPQGRLCAHAWLRSGPVDVTGGAMAAQHAEIAAFR